MLMAFSLPLLMCLRPVVGLSLSILATSSTVRCCTAITLAAGMQQCAVVVNHGQEFSGAVALLRAEDSISMRSVATTHLVPVRVADRSPAKPCR